MSISCHAIFWCWVRARSNIIIISSQQDGTEAWICFSMMIVCELKWPSPRACWLFLSHFTRRVHVHFFFFWARKKYVLWDSDTLWVEKEERPYQHKKFIRWKNSPPSGYHSATAFFFSHCSSCICFAVVAFWIRYLSFSLSLIFEGGWCDALVRRGFARWKRRMKRKYLRPTRFASLPPVNERESYPTRIGFISVTESSKVP